MSNVNSPSQLSSKRRGDDPTTPTNLFLRFPANNDFMVGRARRIDWFGRSQTAQLLFYCVALPSLVLALVAMLAAKTANTDDLDVWEAMQPDPIVVDAEIVELSQHGWGKRASYFVRYQFDAVTKTGQSRRFERTARCYGVSDSLRKQLRFAQTVPVIYSRSNPENSRMPEPFMESVESARFWRDHKTTVWIVGFALLALGGLACLPLEWRWRQAHYLARRGRMLFGQITACSSSSFLVCSRHAFAYSCRSPHGQELKGAEITYCGPSRRRPAEGMPVAVLYLDDNNYLLL
jgi:hypothetical protein